MLRVFSLILTLVIVGGESRPSQAQQPPADGTPNALSAGEAAAGWTLLFDGRTLSGWTQLGEADWRVEDGTMTATKGTGFLVTPKPYENFELKVDFWASETVNSGVFVRCGEGNPGPRTCYEVQIAGETTGTLVNVQPLPSGLPNAIGKWNTYEIRAEGDHVTVKINGTTTADVRDQRLTSGPIALQEGGLAAFGLVRFRNVKVRPL
ncbi:MAG: DUF1080 domain-containing protein [Chloroflexi bacterium]|nr:DUF1080 domain-containing protein [Chloroflexota bacterium]